MRATRFFSVIPLLALIALVLPPQEARAYHDGVHLEVTPEVQSIPVGSAGTMTAIVVDGQGNPSVALWDILVKFENENGANDLDGTTLATPDLTCTVATGTSSCNVVIQGGKTGDAQFRAWIDDRGGTSTNTSDPEEERFSGPGDCDQMNDQPSACVASQTNVPVPGASCGPTGSGAPDTSDPHMVQTPGTEPDCTDVVAIDFAESAGTTVDCDDAGVPDTEHEWNRSGATPSATGEKPSDEIYTCSVRDEFGNLRPGTHVNMEMSGPNDTDSGASYVSPDGQGCNTETKEKDDPTTPPVEVFGFCKITVSQSSIPQKGVATICFWIGTLSQGQEECPGETADSGTSEDGSDQGDNRVDVVELTWENISDLSLDCTPELGFSLVNNTGAVDCLAVSPVTGRPVQGVQVRAEATGANDPDEGDTPQTQDQQPDTEEIAANQDPNDLNQLWCTTGPDGTCSVPHQGVDSGETKYRVWLDDGETSAGNTNPDIDLTEGQDENAAPGVRGEPDSTDVVLADWGQGPTSILMSPKQADGAVGDCHEITITATDSAGEPTRGVRVDVEQLHELAKNTTIDDEPIVEFCSPVAGPNPSDVDETRGDLGSGEGPNTSGIAGGEATLLTDENGNVTIGIRVEAAHGSAGTGSTYVTTWWETSDDDDPGGSEPSDEGSVNWAAGAHVVSVDLTPDASEGDPGTEATFTANVTQNGTPVEGVQVAWSSSGGGTFTWTDSTTDADGRATATVTSSSTGAMTVTASCTGLYTCADTSTHNWGPVTCDVVGTDAPDVLVGTDASETICGFGGNDIIEGGGGDDIILTGAGDDEASGGVGNDELYGEGGLDRLSGNEGADKLYGGAGSDNLLGDAGNDRLYGGAGGDKLSGGGGDDVLKGEDGSDELLGGPGADRLVGGKGQDSVAGGKGDDRCSDETRRRSRGLIKC